MCESVTDGILPEQLKQMQDAAPVICTFLSVALGYYYYTLFSTMTCFSKNCHSNASFELCPVPNMLSHLNSLLLPGQHL